MAWISQFVGHGIFERRAPALVTNMFFVFMAPFFETLKVIQFFVDYRGKDIRDYDKVLKADVAHYRREKGLE